jgi:antitoxin component YwqK of YwqJK toxin-antitoxin module
VGGRLIEVVTYRRGVIDGLYERYTEDGTLDLKGMLERGEPCGMWIEADRAIPYPSCGTRITD